MDKKVGKYSLHMNPHFPNELGIAWTEGGERWDFHTRLSRRTTDAVTYKEFFDSIKTEMNVKDVMRQAHGNILNLY